MSNAELVCTQSGIYKSDCVHQKEISLVKGQPFPKCGQCQQPVTWKLVIAVAI
jgi:hypothetical protein